MGKSDEEKKRDKKRQSARKQKQLASIDNKDDFKKQTRGLSRTQKMKINRKRKKILKKEEKERLQNENNPDNQTEVPEKEDKPYYPGEKLGSLEPPKTLETEITDEKGRSSLLKKIKRMKIQNKVKKTAKKTVNFIVLNMGFVGLILIVFVLSTFTLVALGGIVSIMLSHPAAITEIADANLLGNAEILGNVNNDVLDEAGNVLVEGRDNTTGNNFDWYGISGDDDGRGEGGRPNPENDEDNPIFTGELEGVENDEIIWNYLRSLGFSQAATAGIMGNLMQESGLNPKTIQGNGAGPGKGLVQWEDANMTGGSGRWNNLEKWAAERNRDIWGIDTQLDFMYWEMTEDNWQAGMFRTMYETHEPEFYSQNATEIGEGVQSVEFFKRETDRIRAMYIFEYAFERAGSPMFENRERYTENIWDKFSGRGR